jgi:hypothetical protein
MENLDARIQSRMLDDRLCNIYAILAPAYRGGGGARPDKKQRVR